jgi:hypothetical protein
MLDIDPEHGAMKCPHCGDIYTHVNTVLLLNAAGDSLQIVARGEDEASRFDVTTMRAPTQYVGRRYTVVLSIDCENCSVRSHVSLHQHKGNTMARIDFQPVPEGSWSF